MIRNIEFLAAAQIGERWGCHPGTAARILKRFGHAGVKFGASKQSARRWRETDVEQVEKQAAIILAKP